MECEDILEELSNAEIESLAEMYELHKDELPYLHSFLQNCIKSKKIGLSDFVTVFSPRNCWRVDGTFIASMPAHGHDIVLHSLDRSGKNLMEGLMNTRRFKFLRDPARDYTFFYAVHELFYSEIFNLLTEVLRHEIVFSDILNVWCLEKEKAFKQGIKPTRDVYVKEIEPQDISTISNMWDFRYPDSEVKILHWLKLNKGFGVYLKQNNQLVSWVSSSCLGQSSSLHTLAEHRKKGYGSLVVVAMAKELASSGFDCCATVYPGNRASEALFEKLGFEIKCRCQFIAVHNKN